MTDQKMREALEAILALHDMPKSVERLAREALSQREAAQGAEPAAFMTQKALDKFAEHRANNATAADLAHAPAYATAGDGVEVPLYTAAPSREVPAEWTPEQIADAAKAAGIEPHPAWGGLTIRMNEGRWIDVTGYLTKFASALAAAPEGSTQAGLNLAAGYIRKQLDDYDADHGSTDPETGTREYPGNGGEWVHSMAELADEIEALGSAPAAAPAVPDDMVLVPKTYLIRILALTHNWSLKAIPPDYYDGMAGDAFQEAYRRCGRDLAEAKALLPSAPASGKEG